MHGPAYGLNGTNGNATNTSVKVDNWNVTNTLAYQLTLGTQHALSLLVGYDVQKFKNSLWGATRSQLADSFFDTFEGSYANIAPVTNVLTDRAIVSSFARFTYNFKQRYFLTVNVRRDGLSALGSGKKYGLFGGASGGGALSQEKFFKNSSLAAVVTNLKLRASWGKISNANLPNAYGSLLLYNSALYSGATTWIFSQGGNLDLGWESSKQTNVGADVGRRPRAFRATRFCKTWGPCTTTAWRPASRLAFGQFSWSTNLNYTYNQNRGFRSNELLRNILTILAKVTAPSITLSQPEDIFPIPNAEISSNKLLQAGLPAILRPLT